MSISAVVGHAQGLDAREVGSQSALRAISQASRRPIMAGFVIASDFFDFSQVLNGVKAILGDTPLLGLSTSGELTVRGSTEESVIVALLVGTDFTVLSNWWPDFGMDSQSVSLKMIEAFHSDLPNSLFLAVADGFQGDPQELCESIPEGNFLFAGCLAGGEFKRARTFQAGGTRAGSGGLAGACFKGNLTAGIGFGSGWKEVGVEFTVTSVRGPWIETLNDRPVAEVYSHWLGYSPREWRLPPLNRLARLYPLGFDYGMTSHLLVRAPIKIESDGSMRLHTQVPLGSQAHLMAGSIETCLQATQQAVEGALLAIGKARPILALVFADAAWQILMESRPGAEAAVVRKNLGDHVPIAGGYVLGQLVKENQEVFFSNQQIQIILLAETIA